MAQTTFRISFRLKGQENYQSETSSGPESALAAEAQAKLQATGVVSTFGQKNVDSGGWVTCTQVYGSPDPGTALVN